MPRWTAIDGLIAEIAVDGIIDCFALERGVAGWWGSGVVLLVSVVGKPTWQANVIDGP